MEHLYIVEGEHGLLKVGRTTNFDGRLPHLRHEFKKQGEKVARFKTFAPLANAHYAEQSVIAALRRKGHLACYGREWFQGVPFFAVARLALIATKREALEADLPVIGGVVAAARASYLAHLVERKGGPEAYEAWRAEFQERQQRAALRKQTGERAFAAMQASLSGAFRSWSPVIDHHPV